jgi:hypothetical protein
MFDEGNLIGPLKDHVITYPNIEMEVRCHFHRYRSIMNRFLQGKERPEWDCCFLILDTALCL